MDPMVDKRQQSRDSRSLVTESQFYGAIRDLQQRFDRIELKLDAHNDRTQDLDNRVLVMETERESEKGQITKRGTLYGIVGGASLAAIWRIAEHLLFTGPKP